jgi:hypothetical protein
MAVKGTFNTAGMEYLWFTGALVILVGMLPSDRSQLLPDIKLATPDGA